MSELIKEEAGVRLLLYDVPPTKTSGKGGIHYKLKTMRQNQPRVFADMNEAIREYELEVEASRSDPMIAKLLQRMR